MKKPSDKFFYQYDFGDDWMHEVLVEQILEPVPKETYLNFMTHKLV